MNLKRVMISSSVISLGMVALMFATFFSIVDLQQEIQHKIQIEHTESMFSWGEVQ